MIDIITEIKVIETYYVKAEFQEAYEALYKLCQSNLCSEFNDAAISILSRFNDCQKCVMLNTIGLTEQENRNREIGKSYQILMLLLKKKFIESGENFYEEQAIRLEANKNVLKNTLLQVEEDYRTCQNEKKSKVLLQIKQEISKVISYFKNLIKNFRMIQRYD